MTDMGLTFGPAFEGLSAEDAARQSDRCFVRSEGQLAVYEASRNPTGHMLTAWEAFNAYGLDVLEEAVEYGAAILKRTKNSTGNALERRRTDLGLNHESVRVAAQVPASVVWTAESNPSKVPLADLERIAFTLGLDERLLAFKRDAGGDNKFTYRLRTLLQEGASAAGTISAGAALLFSEAASIIRVQHRLQKWLSLQAESDRFIPVDDYGSRARPAWRLGYDLARQARNALELGNSPVPSMRELVEKRLGIPVVQARLPDHIAGATVMTMDEDGREARGVVLNTVGENENVWIRRATLAHELGHLLYDPDARLQNVRVDSYLDNLQDPEQDPEIGMPATDFVEQRANAFAIAFLAPNDEVRSLAPTPVSVESVAEVMHTFGISYTAARYHIANCHYRTYDVPLGVIDQGPSDEQKAAEDFTVDFFPISSTRDQRRGRFSGLVAECYAKGLISKDTGALYLQCSADDFLKNVGNLRELSGIETS